MAVRTILLADDPKLRQKAKKVKVFGKELKQLADDMIETMRDAPGVGLAGPQIGMMQRIFVVEIPKEEDNPLSGMPFVVVNPEVTKRSSRKAEGEEGCLSMPGWLGLVDRHTNFEIKARDVHGKPFKLKLDGLLARVFQHEYDHLNGVLFIDHITEDDKLWEIEDKPEED